MQSIQHPARHGVTRIEFEASPHRGGGARPLAELGVSARECKVRGREAGVELDGLLERFHSRRYRAGAEIGDSQVGVCRGLPRVQGDGLVVRGGGAVQGALLHHRESQLDQNLRLAGRTGLFWYNNMDHSIENAMQLTRRLLRDSGVADAEEAALAAGLPIQA